MKYIWWRDDLEQTNSGQYFTQKIKIYWEMEIFKLSRYNIA